MEERIVARLTEALDPIPLDVVDESDRHAGHAGAREGGGTHYRVRIVSAQFERRSRVERHRLVYGLLTAEFADGLHALALVAKAPASHDGGRPRRIRSAPTRSPSPPPKPKPPRLGRGCARLSGADCSPVMWRR